MSEYPASLGDLAEVEARLDARLSRVEKRQENEATITDEKFAALRGKLTDDMVQTDELMTAVGRLIGRVEELERLWAVALENPDLVRELAAQALKGREPG